MTRQMDRLRLSSLLLPMLLTGCSSLSWMGDWFGSDNNEEPPAELVDFVATRSMQRVWGADVGQGAGGQDLRLVPRLEGDRIFAADRTGLVEALDALTGSTVWRVERELSVSGGPGSGEGLVLLGTSDAKVVALDEATGDEVWRSRVSSEVLSVPQIAQGLVVVHTIDGTVTALAASDGERRWIYQRAVPTLTLRGGSTPFIYGATVICGFAGGKLVALDLLTGKLVWEASVTAPSGRSELERMVDIDADPVLADGVVYATTYQGDLAAVGAETGVVLWRRKLSSYAGLSADWRRIYVTDSADTVWAIDNLNGAALWKQRQMHGRRLTAPAILGDYLLVGDFEGYLHLLSTEDGSLAARIRIGDGPISSKPRVADETAYVLGDEGVLAAIRAAEPAGP